MEDKQPGKSAGLFVELGPDGTGNPKISKEPRAFVRRLSKMDGAAWLSVIAAILGIGVALYTYLSGEYIHNISKISALSQTASNSQEINKIKTEAEIIERHMFDIQQLEKQIPKDDALYIGLQKLSHSVNDLNSRESKLESVILQNPAKALETPLLRRDLDNMKEFQQESLLSLKDSVDRIYDLNKWLLGATSISIVSLAVVNLLKSRQANG